jgi:hypothetical protein
MNFLFITPSHVSARINGADMYDQLLCEELQRRGHNAVIIAQMTATDNMNGVSIRPYSESGKLIKWADVISCRPQQYLRLPLKGKNVVCIQHNTIPELRLKGVKMVYVAEHLRRSIAYDLPNMVLHPINRYKGANPLTGGNKIALVNCNKNKGGSELIQLAAMMPEQQFVGVSGYGTQIKGDRLNIEYRQPSLNLPEVLQGVGMVVSFSKSEGYPMLCMEVQSLGLPFIGSKIAGHIEVGCSNYFNTLGDLCTMIKAGLSIWPLNHDRPEPDIEGFINFCNS